MRILVTGSRNFAEFEYMKKVIEGFCIEENVHWCHGGAKGADMMADRIIQAIRDCDRPGWTIQKFDADWDQYGKYAGPLRNQQMLDEFEPDLVLAFPRKGSKGTWDMIERTLKSEVKVLFR